MQYSPGLSTRESRYTPMRSLIKMIQDRSQARCDIGCTWSAGHWRSIRPQRQRLPELVIKFQGTQEQCIHVDSGVKVCATVNSVSGSAFDCHELRERDSKAIERNVVLTGRY